MSTPVKALQRDWPVPRCVKDIQSFLGFINFYMAKMVMLLWPQLIFLFILFQLLSFVSTTLFITLIEILCGLLWGKWFTATLIRAWFDKRRCVDRRMLVCYNLYQFHLVRGRTYLWIPCMTSLNAEGLCDLVVQNVVRYHGLPSIY